MEKKYFEIHCLKGVRSFSGLYFLAFALSTERCGVSFRMQENMDQKNSEYGHFLRGNNVISEILVLERKKYTFLVYYLSSGLNKVMIKYRSFNYGILPKSKNAVILRYFIFEPSFKLR